MPFAALRAFEAVAINRANQCCCNLLESKTGIDAERRHCPVGRSVPDHVLSVSRQPLGPETSGVLA
jgi:hypothetical protein